ncbi:MAG: M48 family metallopeptidase [Verrucomicrobiota bacterium]|nr:M48 family metallopeptidase [Verrucomicrobiota bacterium]
MAGAITISARVLRFESEMGTVEFPLHDLKVERRDTSEDRIFFTHPTRPGWSIYTSCLDIFSAPALSQNIGVRNQAEKILQRQAGGLRKVFFITITAFASFVIVVVLLFCLTGWIMNFLASKVPPSYEIGIGNEALLKLKDKIQLIDKTTATEELTAMANLLAPAAAKRKFLFKVYLVDIPVPNAFAFPGGNIVVCSGLFNLVKTREELAGVLAHEIAHVALQHHLRKIIANAGPYFVLKVFIHDQRGFFAMIGHGSRLLFQQGFSQQYENQADDAGWNYLVTAHINPHGFRDILERMRGEGELPADSRWQLFSSHPPTQTRIQRLDVKWEKLKNKSGFIPLNDLSLLTNGPVKAE